MLLQPRGGREVVVVGVKLLLRNVAQLISEVSHNSCLQLSPDGCRAMKQRDLARCC